MGISLQPVNKTEFVPYKSYKSQILNFHTSISAAVFSELVLCVCKYLQEHYK